MKEKICQFCGERMIYKGEVAWTGDSSLRCPVENCAGPFSDCYICRRCGYIANFCIATQRKWEKEAMNPSRRE